LFRACQDKLNININLKQRQKCQKAHPVAIHWSDQKAFWQLAEKHSCDHVPLQVEQGRIPVVTPRKWYKWTFWCISPGQKV
jgi:hypothetical protein